MYSNGLGDTWTIGKSCPAMPSEDAAFVLNNATPAELAGLHALAPDTDTSTAIAQRNPLALAWHLAGGDDCATTSTRGRAFLAAFRALLAAVETRNGVVCDVDPRTGVYTCPEITVSVPGGTPTTSPGGTVQAGAAKYLPWLLGGVGLLALMAGDRSKARRR